MRDVRLSRPSSMVKQTHPKRKGKDRPHGLSMLFFWLRQIIVLLLQACLLEINLLYNMIGGFLMTFSSRGWFSMKLQFSITIRLSFFAAGWYVGASK